MTRDTPAVATTCRTYAFHDVTACNMCGANAAEAKVLGLRLDKSQGRNPRGRRGIAVSVCRCHRCGTIFASPQPVPASIADHYGIPPESYWHDVSYDVPRGYFDWQTETAARLIDFRPGMKAIDVGLGLGQTARVLRDKGFDVYGFEPSEPFFEKAIGILGKDDERFKLATIEDIEFPENQFDFVSFGAVLEHVYDPSAALAKATRWLRPGGIIYAEIPNANHLVSRLINAFYRALGTSFVTNTSPMHVPFHLFEFTLDSFHRNGARIGYKVVAHVVEVASIYNIPRIFHAPLRNIMKRRGTGMQLTVWLRKNP